MLKLSRIAQSMVKYAMAYILTGSQIAMAEIDPALAQAERFVDAFYSFQPSPLNEMLGQAESSKPEILFYQGWAEGAEYKIVKRNPCTWEREYENPDDENQMRVVCRIKVADNLIKALELDIHVTDVFTLILDGNFITKVSTSSDDPEEFWAARDWVVENRPDLFTSVCKGLFNGGPTPGLCAQAFIEGFAAYRQQKDQ